MSPLIRFSLLIALSSIGTGCKTPPTTPPSPRGETIETASPDTRPGPAAAVTEDPKQRHVPGNPPPPPPDMAAYASARPALERHCFRCHTSAGPKAKARTLKHLSFDQYPPTGHHAREMAATFRHVLLGNPAKAKGPTMPADDRGAPSKDELAKIIAWADAFDEARGGHRRHRSPTHR